jgi:hypothetical protein
MLKKKSKNTLDIILLFFCVLLSNLNPCFNCTFHFRKNKRNVSSNALISIFFHGKVMHASMFGNVHVMHLIK